MKNLFLIIILITIIFSCTIPEVENFEFNNPKFNNIKEACEWINNNIKYKKENGNNWKLPQETLDDKNGDCEDMAILLMAIMEYQKGYESELIIVKLDNNIYHAIVLWKDKYYDCTSGKTIGNKDYTITEKYDYYTTMYEAKYKKN